MLYPFNYKKYIIDFNYGYTVDHTAQPGETNVTYKQNNNLIGTDMNYRDETNNVIDGIDFNNSLVVYQAKKSTYTKLMFSFCTDY